MSVSLLTLIAVQSAAARQSLLERFRIADATRPERAQTLASLGIASTGTFEELVRKGAIRETRPGSYYLDEAAVAALGKTQPTLALKVFMITAAVVGFILLIVLFALRARQ